MTSLLLALAATGSYHCQARAPYSTKLYLERAETYEAARDAALEACETAEQRRCVIVACWHVAAEE